MDMINKANRTNSFSATSFKFKEQERKEDESQKAQSIKDENERASIHSKSAPILISSTQRIWMMKTWVATTLPR